MNAWNKWTHRREEWENNNTRETSKIYGNKNFKCTELKENKNGMRELKKNQRKITRDKLSKPKKLSSYKNINKSYNNSTQKLTAHTQPKVDLETTEILKIEP